MLKCPYYAFSNITFQAVCHVAVCEQNFCKVVKPTVRDKKKKTESARNRLNKSSGIRLFFFYEVTNLHNTPMADIHAVRVTNHKGLRHLTNHNSLERLILLTASHKSFRNHLEMK